MSYVAPYVYAPITLFGFWLLSLYLDTKFSYVSPRRAKIKLSERAPLWRRIVVNCNFHVKNLSLMSVWALAVSYAYLFKILPKNRVTLGFYILATVICLATYIVARLWRFLVREDHIRREI